MAEFTLAQAMKAQATLRAAGGQPEETFSTEQLVGMLSDEIRALREMGLSDDATANILKAKADIDLDAKTIERFYVDTSAYGAHPES